MEFQWPSGFQRIPNQDWTKLPVEALALKYDKVENHGWYKNLEPTIDELCGYLKDGHIIIDYSGGTGILIDKLLHRLSEWQGGLVIADSSPKFLRLALDKLCFEQRVAFRLIQYLKEQKRLEFLEDVLENEILKRGFDGLVSTNAIHLYYDLTDTLASWHRVLKNGARIFIQSGNVRNPDAESDEWIIDDTVESINKAAIEIVRGDEKYSQYRATLDDPKAMSGHAALRQKYFIPIRGLDYYLDAFKKAGFSVLNVRKSTIPALVKEWYSFLKVYHEGVLGWVGGSKRVEGRNPTKDNIHDRLEIMKRAMKQIFQDQEEFNCCWTYITCQK